MIKRLKVWRPILQSAFIAIAASRGDLGSKSVLSRAGLQINTIEVVGSASQSSLRQQKNKCKNDHMTEHTHILKLD